jgi:hypothetical protein
VKGGAAHGAEPRPAPEPRAGRPGTSPLTQARALASPPALRTRRTLPQRPARAGVRRPSVDARANRRGHRVKPSTKTWAALAVMAVEGTGSAEAEQNVSRPRDDLRGFRSYPQNGFSERSWALCGSLAGRSGSARLTAAQTPCSSDASVSTRQRGLSSMAESMGVGSGASPGAQCAPRLSDDSHSKDPV